LACFSETQDTTSKKEQEPQLMLTNPHDVVRGQSRSPNIVPFHMLGIVSYYCEIVTDFCAIFPVYNFKNAVTLKTGLVVRQGRWKYHHLIEGTGLPIHIL